MDTSMSAEDSSSVAPLASHSEADSQISGTYGTGDSLLASQSQESSLLVEGERQGTPRLDNSALHSETQDNMSTSCDKDSSNKPVSDNQVKNIPNPLSFANQGVENSHYSMQNATHFVGSNISHKNLSQQQWEQKSKLFIGGLTVTTTDQMLQQYFAKYGEVIDAVVMKDRTTARSRGFGFVTFRDPDMLNAAQAARPHEIDGKQVETKRAMPREDSANPESHVTVNKIFCGSIKREITEAEVRDYFSQFGHVTECELLQKRETGESRGFAFITFDDYDPVDQILLSRPHCLGGKPVDVRKALTRDQQVELKQKQQHQQASRQHSNGGGGGANPYINQTHPQAAAVHALQSAVLQHPSFFCPPIGSAGGNTNNGLSAHLHPTTSAGLDSNTNHISPTMLSPNLSMALTAYSMLQQAAFAPPQYAMNNSASGGSFSSQHMSGVPSSPTATNFVNPAATAAWLNSSNGGNSTPTSPIVSSWPLHDPTSLYGNPLSPLTFYNPYNGMCCFAPPMAAPNFATMFNTDSLLPQPVPENGTTSALPFNDSTVNNSSSSKSPNPQTSLNIPATQDDDSLIKTKLCKTSANAASSSDFELPSSNISQTNEVCADENSSKVERLVTNGISEVLVAEMKEKLVVSAVQDDHVKMDG